MLPKMILPITNNRMTSKAEKVKLQKYTVNISNRLQPIRTKQNPSHNINSQNHNNPDD